MSRRILLFFLLLLLASSALLTRLYLLQIKEGRRMSSLAHGNRIRLLRTHPARGVILDRKGRVLASNDAVFSIQVPVQYLKADSPKLPLLVSALHLSPKELHKAQRMHEYGFSTIKEKVNANFLVPLLEKPPVEGLLVKTDPIRMYFAGDEIAHVVGYVGEVNPEELSPTTPAGSLIGKSGIEAQYDTLLRGREGGRQVEVDAHMNILRVLGEKVAVSGKTLSLTIDSRLQKYAQHLLKRKKGAVVILNAQTGAVLVIVSSPSFDPALLVPPVEESVWKRILNDPAKPLLNRAIAGYYPPASTFKLITLLAAPLKSPNPTFTCKGYLKVGRRIFHCWKRSGHGRLNLVQAISESCDVVFYTLGLRAGIRSLLDQSRQLGIGESTGLDILGEKSGFLPTPRWKNDRFHTRWFPGDTVNFSIGQGYLQATPLQMSRVIALFANGHTLPVPFIAKRAQKRALAKSRPVTIPNEKLRIARLGMRRAVVEGTAKQAFLKNIPVAGKTGTAQDPSKKKPHAWFIGYAPYPEGKIAMAILIEEGGGGGKVAAPIARKLFYALHKLGYI